jgi:hypothetical protein
MLVLLAAGVMSRLVWMAVIAAVITVEKVLPRGEVLAQVISALLLAVGVLLLAAPELAAAGSGVGHEGSPDHGDMPRYVHYPAGSRSHLLITFRRRPGGEDGPGFLRAGRLGAWTAKSRRADGERQHQRWHLARRRAGRPGGPGGSPPTI